MHSSQQLGLLFEAQLYSFVIFDTRWRSVASIMSQLLCPKGKINQYTPLGIKPWLSSNTVHRLVTTLNDLFSSMSLYVSHYPRLHADLSNGFEDKTRELMNTVTLLVQAKSSIVRIWSFNAANKPVTEHDHTPFPFTSNPYNVLIIVLISCNGHKVCVIILYSFLWNIFHFNKYLMSYAQNMCRKACISSCKLSIIFVEF
jgi:hypothetical protein